MFWLYWLGKPQDFSFAHGGVWITVPRLPWVIECLLFRCRECSNSFFLFGVYSEGSVQPIHSGPNSQILQNVLSTHDPKYRTPETLEIYPTWSFWGNHKILENLQNQEPGQAKFKPMRMQRKQQNLMRVKQVKFRGRKMTDKQSAEKCLKNTQLLHPFYHLTTRTSFGLQLYPLIGQKTTVNKSNYRKGKTKPQTRSLPILQPNPLQATCHIWFPVVWTGIWFFLYPNICMKYRIPVTRTSLCNMWNYLEIKRCFTLQEKELYSKPNPSICAATQTTLTAPVLEIHGDKAYFLLLLLHGPKNPKFLTGINTIREIYIKSHQ